MSEARLLTAEELAELRERLAGRLNDSEEAFAWRDDITDVLAHIDALSAQLAAAERVVAALTRVREWQEAWDGYIESRWVPPDELDTQLTAASKELGVALAAYDAVRGEEAGR